MQHVLSNVTKQDLHTDPFPYVVIHDALPPELVDDLIQSYPSVETVADTETLGNNKRFSFSTGKVRQSDDVADLWKQFIEAHVSQDFLDRFLEIFGESILQYYPDFETRYAPLDSLRAGVRKVDPEAPDAVALDAQICVNTPVTAEPTSVKIAHVDNGKKLFGGLFYLRSDVDDSVGGDLEIYRYKNENKKNLHGPRLVDRSLVEYVDTVPYKKNTLVLFLNTIDSLHGVTVREKTEHPRLFMNLIGEVAPDLFDTDEYQEGKLQKLERKIKKVF